MYNLDNIEYKPMKQLFLEGRHNFAENLRELRACNFDINVYYQKHPKE